MTTRSMLRRVRGLGGTPRSALDDALEDVARQGRRIGHGGVSAMRPRFERHDPDEIDAMLERLANTPSRRGREISRSQRRHEGSER